LITKPNKVESVLIRTVKSRLKENGLLFYLRAGKEYAEDNNHKENTASHTSSNGGNFYGQISRSNRPTFGLSLRAKRERKTI